MRRPRRGRTPPSARAMATSGGREVPAPATLPKDQPRLEVDDEVEVDHALASRERRVVALVERLRLVRERLA